MTMIQLLAISTFIPLLFILFLIFYRLVLKRDSKQDSFLYLFLMPREEIIYEKTLTEKQRTIYLVLLAFSSMWLGWFIIPLVYFYSPFNEYLITSKKIIVSDGIIFRRVRELDISKIESITTEIGLFHSGKVSLKGTGGSIFRLNRVKDIYLFIEKRTVR